MSMICCTYHFSPYRKDGHVFPMSDATFLLEAGLEAGNEDPLTLLSLSLQMSLQHLSFQLCCSRIWGSNSLGFKKKEEKISLRYIFCT